MTTLKQIRVSLGWSQVRTMSALRSAATARGIKLPKTDTLKRELARWENQSIEPSELYRELFCEIYGRTGAELGFTPPRPSFTVPSTMLTRLATARAAAPVAVQSFRAQLDAIRAVDRQLGAPAVLNQLRSVASAIEQMLTHSLMPSVREPLAAVLADAATLAGWQALDLGDIEQSWKWHETAKAAAREADDLAGLAHAMGQQSCLLVDIGEVTGAVELANAAVDRGRGHVPSVLSAWLSAVEAEAKAAARDTDGMRKALDTATASLPADDARSELPYITLDDGHLARWRGCVLARVGDGEAVAALYEAAERVDSSFVRARASLECDLGLAMLARGDRRKARLHANAARELAKRVGSVRQRRRAEAVASAS